MKTTRGPRRVAVRDLVHFTRGAYLLCRTLWCPWNEDRHILASAAKGRGAGRGRTDAKRQKTTNSNVVPSASGLDPSLFDDAGGRPSY